MPKTTFNPITRYSTILSLLFISLANTACNGYSEQTLVTIADARKHPAIFVKLGSNHDAAGDILVFDQPLLNPQHKPIGNNSGSCIRTRPGVSFQCQWTLTLKGGSIQVAGKEFDKNISSIAIVGGTGLYSGIQGEMISTNNGDNTFTQTLIYHLN